MDAIALVALTDVAPIEHDDPAVGPATDFLAAEPRIGGEEKVGRVFAHISAAAAFEDVLIGAAAVEVQGEEAAAIFGGPVIALVNHHPDVHMTAAEAIRGGRVAQTLAGVEVIVIAVLVEQSVDARIRIDGVPSG